MDIDKLLTSNLFRTVFPNGSSFIWRCLSIQEYELFAKLRAGAALHPIELAMQVLKRALVGEPVFLYSSIPVGYIVGLSDLIMYESGDCHLDRIREDITTARATLVTNSTVDHMKKVIYTAWPQYLPSDLESLTRTQLIELFVRAEDLLAFRLPDFAPLDVNKIVLPSSEQLIEHRIQTVDFEEENANIRRAQGFNYDEDKIREKRRLSKEELAQITRKSMSG